MGVEAYLDGCDQSENVDACTFVLDNNLSGTVEGNITMVAKENIFNPSDGEKYRCYTDGWNGHMLTDLEECKPLDACVSLRCPVEAGNIVTLPFSADIDEGYLDMMGKEFRIQWQVLGIHPHERLLFFSIPFSNTASD